MEKIQVIHLEMVKDKELFYDERLQCPEQVCQMARECFQNDDRESCYVCGVDASNVPIYVEKVALGNLNSCCIAMRDIFKALILSNCASFFFWHTHTSFGKINASREDKLITRKMKEMGEYLGINLRDHLIIGRDGYLSFVEKGEL